jgi:hypothetical protein
MTFARNFARGSIDTFLFYRALKRFIAIRFKSGYVFGYAPSRPA